MGAKSNLLIKTFRTAASSSLSVNFATQTRTRKVLLVDEILIESRRIWHLWVILLSKLNLLQVKREVTDLKNWEEIRYQHELRLWLIKQASHIARAEIDAIREERTPLTSSSSVCKVVNWMGEISFWTRGKVPLRLMARMRVNKIRFKREF